MEPRYPDRLILASFLSCSDFLSLGIAKVFDRVRVRERWTSGLKSRLIPCLEETLNLEAVVVEQVQEQVQEQTVC